jgi:hypothetical protein
MNGIEFHKIDFDELANKCLRKADTDSGLYTKNDYWNKCSLFVRSLKNKAWENLTYKQINWLQNIIDEI